MSPARLLIPTFCLILTACSIPTRPDGIDDNAMTRLGDQLASRGDDAGAADFYQRTLQKKPNDLVALRKLAAILETHGNIEAADGYYAKALQMAPDDMDLLHAHARLLIRTGRYDQARAAYQKIVSYDRHDVKAQNGLGIALDYLNQHADAQQHYAAALADDRDNLTTLNNYAHSYVLDGKYEDAIVLLEPHATDRNATPALRQNLAEAYGMAGMYADAERLARIDLKPADVKKNLAYYRAHRAKIVPMPKFAADLGSYATSAMAEAREDLVRGMISDANVTVTITPQVQAIGGTPSFALQAAGFKNAAELGSFCEQAMKAEISCSIAK